MYYILFTLHKLLKKYIYQKCIYNIRVYNISIT